MCVTTKNIWNQIVERVYMVAQKTVIPLQSSRIGSQSGRSCNGWVLPTERALRKKGDVLGKRWR